MFAIVLVLADVLIIPFSSDPFAVPMSKSVLEISFVIASVIPKIEAFAFWLAVVENANEFIPIFKGFSAFSVF